MIVGIEQVGTMIAMAGKMQLDHASGGYRINVRDSVEAMVKCANEDVVDVEQDSAVGLRGHSTEEFPLRKS